MNSNQNENARTSEDTRRKTNTAANTINAFFNNKTKMQRQEAIEDKRQLHEENEYNSKRLASYSRRHPKKAEKCSKNNNATWIRQRRLNDRRRQSKIEDSYMEQNEFESE